MFAKNVSRETFFFVLLKQEKYNDKSEKSSLISMVILKCFT